MSTDERLLMDENEFIQIKDLNRVNDIKNSDLLLLDDGVASCNAITYENFLQKTKDKTFKGEGLSYFKEVIKDIIATELAENSEFTDKLYSKLLSKLMNNDSSYKSNLSSYIRSDLTSNMSSYSHFSSSDKFVTISSYNSLQKTTIPEYLTGIPSSFSSSRTSTTSTRIYESSLRDRAYRLNMTQNTSSQDVTLVFYKFEDGKPIYLDVYVDIEINSYHDVTKRVYLQYTDESSRSIVYERIGKNLRLNDYSPLFRGWYMQKRSYTSGTVPSLVKL
ncbi:DUF685 domain-containing protein (plasmid) [Borrelia puertoricensis]|uniref:DUF685 domain-containing protein n=1 Tax=Borrelia puertoricensis TaxID=2756107 RepID=UPI001FF60A88|nr:DUF685 domain-containing protein [Borrelia puertoricensis]